MKEIKYDFECAELQQNKIIIFFILLHPETKEVLCNLGYSQLIRYAYTLQEINKIVELCIKDEECKLYIPFEKYKIRYSVNYSDLIPKPSEGGFVIIYKGEVKIVSL